MFIVCTDYLIQFGEGLGREAQEMEKVWDGVLGRYYRAVQRLVVDALLESQNPVEKLVYAVKQMRTPESAQRVAQTVQKGKSYSPPTVEYFGYFTHTYMQTGTNVHTLIIPVVFLGFALGDAGLLVSLASKRSWHTNACTNSNRIDKY